MVTFARGDLSPVTWSPQNLGFTATLNVKDASWDVMCVLFDVSNTEASGDTMRIRGKRDASATMNASLDLDGPSYGPTVILVEGQPGIWTGFLGPTKGYQIGAVVEKIHYQGASMDKECLHSADIKMNKLAGFLVYPTFP